jgi:hypothetical protein
MKEEKVAEKVKSAVIPGIEATRNLSFCGRLHQKGSLVRLGGLGMTDSKGDLMPEPKHRPLKSIYETN